MHSLHVWSPVSSTVCVLAQSTIVTLLSLPWLGLLLVFVRFLCLRLTLWASACVGPHGYRPSPGSVLLLQPGFLFSGLVVWGSFHPVPSPLSSFGMWSPFRVISVLCHLIDDEGFLWRGFSLGGSLPFRRGVVVSLRPLSQFIMASCGCCHRFSLLHWGYLPSRWGHPCGVVDCLSSIGTKV